MGFTSTPFVKAHHGRSGKVFTDVVESSSGRLVRELLPVAPGSPSMGTNS